MTPSQILAHALGCYRVTRDYDRSTLSPIWQANIDQHFLPLIAGATDVKATLNYLQDRAFFDVSVKGPQLPYAIDWFMNSAPRLYRQWGLVSESNLFSDDRCQLYDGIRLSTDSLWRQLLVDRMVYNSCNFDRVLELGSGCGNLARVLRLSGVKAKTHVLVDLPESLFCAQIFLMSEFSDASFHYVTSLEDRVFPDKYNFIFVPAHLRDWLQGQHFDLFINTNSLGEMPGTVVRDWFRFIENDVRVDKLFLLNRFMNRSQGNPDACCSLALGLNWKILDWEVDPEFERSPYTTTLITRNLLIVAERGIGYELPKLIKGVEFNPSNLDAVMHEDWALRPYWDNYELKFAGHYPPPNSRASPFLTHDLTMSGSLFKMWENRRLGNEAASEGMARWMDIVSGPDRFEESELLWREVNC